MGRKRDKKKKRKGKGDKEFKERRGQKRVPENGQSQCVDRDTGKILSHRGNLGKPKWTGPGEEETLAGDEVGLWPLEFTTSAADRSSL